MKKGWLIFILLSLVIITGCSSKESLINRIDIDFAEGEDKMIVEEETIHQFSTIWETIEKKQDEEKPDENESVKLTLFISTDPNKPERLYEFSIWFTDVGASIWDHENEGLGTLEIDESKELQNILENNSKPGI